MLLTQVRTSRFGRHASGEVLSNSSDGGSGIGSFSAKFATFRGSRNARGNSGCGSSVNVAARFYSTTPGLKHGTVILGMNTVSGKDSISFTGVATGDTLKPQFALSKTSIDFGSVVNGKTKQDSVIISNPGTLTLEVSTISKGVIVRE